MTLLRRIAALAFLGSMAATPVMAQPGVARLHDALRLRADQEPAWQRFEQASGMDSQDDARHRDAFERMARLPAPQRMDLSISLMRSDLEGMERRADALKDFYGALSPDQQAAFDRETLRPPE